MQRANEEAAAQAAHREADDEGAEKPDKDEELVDVGLPEAPVVEAHYHRVRHRIQAELRPGLAPGRDALRCVCPGSPAAAHEMRAGTNALLTTALKAL